jgi:hypothetical protein
VPRIGEDLFGVALFDDFAFVEKEYAVPDFSRKAHLVRDHDHGHAALGEV